MEPSIVIKRPDRLGPRVETGWRSVSLVRSVRARALLGAGARSYLTKDAGRADIARAIRAAAAGQAVLDRTVSEATVKTHINNLFAKTALHDRAEAVRYAYTHGLIQTP
jgi:DNA-binding NarL/FixJ family response regulator